MLVAVIQITANIMKLRIMIIMIEHLPFQRISAVAKQLNSVLLRDGFIDDDRRPE